MKRLNEILQWLDSNENLAYSLIRIFLGIALFVRGWLFFSNPGEITKLAAVDNMHMWYSYITIAHLAGGLLLTLGFLTRIAALFQVPILIGAVFIVHTKQDLMMVGQSLELAVLVLVLLVIFTFFGPGSFSLNKYLAIRRSRNVLEREAAVSA